MDAIAEPTTRELVLRDALDRETWACGWCKVFVHWETHGGMKRMVHDEEPLTDHEVLPYRLS